jgi:hypothetical protein
MEMADVFMPPHAKIKASIPEISPQREKRPFLPGHFHGMPKPYMYLNLNVT